MGILKCRATDVSSIVAMRCAPIWCLQSCRQACLSNLPDYRADGKLDCSGDYAMGKKMTLAAG
jgi:hypothetical protein